SELRHRLRVLREEQGLDARVRRSVLVDDGHELGLDRDESLRELALAFDVEHAVRHVCEPRPDAPHDAPAEVARAGIEAEHDAHESRCSSSSDTSKSAYTFATSSWSSRTSARFKSTSASRPATDFFVFGMNASCEPFVAI